MAAELSKPLNTPISNMPLFTLYCNLLIEPSAYQFLVECRGLNEIDELLTLDYYTTHGIPGIHIMLKRLGLQDKKAQTADRYRSNVRITSKAVLNYYVPKNLDKFRELVDKLNMQGGDREAFESYVSLLVNIRDDINATLVDDSTADAPARARAFLDAAKKAETDMRGVVGRQLSRIPDVLSTENTRKQMYHANVSLNAFEDDASVSVPLHRLRVYPLLARQNVNMDAVLNAVREMYEVMVDYVCGVPPEEKEEDSFRYESRRNRLVDCIRRSELPEAAEWLVRIFSA